MSKREQAIDTYVNQKRFEHRLWSEKDQYRNHFGNGWDARDSEVAALTDQLRAAEATIAEALSEANSAHVYNTHDCGPVVVEEVRDEIVDILSRAHAPEAGQCTVTHPLIDSGAACIYLEGHEAAGVPHTTRNGFWWHDDVTTTEKSLLK